MSGLQDNLLAEAAPVVGADYDWRKQVTQQWSRDELSSRESLDLDSGSYHAEATGDAGNSAATARGAGDAGRHPARVPPRSCGTRTMLVGTLVFGIFCQTALRSVPSFVFNGADGMAAELGYSNTQRGAILSAFGWAYTVMQIPAGFMSQTFGPKKTLLGLVTLGFVAGLVTPFVADRASFIGPLVLNAVIGVSQGGTFPISNGILATWLSVDELGTGNGLLGAFWHLGQVFQFLLSPLLLRIQIQDWRPGWRLAWYFYGGFGLIWSILWWWVASDSPRTHPRITPAEVEEIEARQSRALQKPRRRQFSEAENTRAAEAAAKPSQFDLRLFCRICRQPTVIAMSICAMLDGAAGAYANWMPQSLLRN